MYNTLSLKIPSFALPHYLPAFLEAVSAAASTDSAEAGCSGVSAVVGLFLASRAITAALNTLSVLSISGGKGIPSSLGQSHCSLWLVCSNSSRVPVSGSKAVGEAAGRFLHSSSSGYSCNAGSSAFLVSAHLFHSISPNSIHGCQNGKMSFSTFANRDDVRAAGSK
jgi:hypothetical protein